MAETTNYGLQKPAGTDYYDIDVHNANMDAIDAQMKANEEAAEAAAEAVAPHTHGEADLPDASTSAQGVVQLSSSITSTSETAAATPKAVKLVNDKAVALEAINAPLTTSGTAPAFTIAPTPAISAYADGQQWTVRFHAAGENPTLNVSGKGAATILEATGKAAKVKAGQIARVMRLGANFFTVSGGGGIALPTSIVAGETVLYGINTKKTTSNQTYKDVGTGWGFTALKAGTYRLKYNAAGNGAAYGMARITKNGVVVSGSEIDTSGAAAATIDVSLAVGDVIKEQYAYNSVLSFIVSILATDLQAGINEIITVV